MSESTLTICQSRLYPPVRDLGFGLSLKQVSNRTILLLTLAAGNNHEKSEKIHGIDVLSISTTLKTFDVMRIA
jgi:hypothetical protein